ncbi:MAG: 4Fe-4S binding protein [Chloroflexi bacterium]|nr:4Fe-4S binding protein [Chloroflexota bacterium]
MTATLNEPAPKPARLPQPGVLSGRGLSDRVARKLVQIGFLALFLYPLLPIVLRRITFQPAPTLLSWLLPWDPLLLFGQLLHRDWSVLVIGAPLLLLALTLIFGRAFCGWVCPIGAVLDLIRPLAFWQKGKRRASANSPLRYYLLIAVLVAGVLSLQALGLLDPLVIFQRTTTALMVNAFALQQRPLAAYLVGVSFLFLGIIALELWQPRFWCRHLCPLGALLSVTSRWSLLNRRVSNACTYCGDCRRVCPMNAIPRREPHDTDYTQCTFCLVCQSACPNSGISFGFGLLAERAWQRVKGRSGRLVKQGVGPRLSRRQFVGGVAAGAAGLALVPVSQLPPRQNVIRPPGALPEDEFVRTCILCQECVRVCPTGGLKPTLAEAGIAAMGTPKLVPRQGGCALNSSCSHLCAQACPVGAIQRIQPAKMKIGLAHVERHLCLAWDQEVKCLVCVEACTWEAALPFHGRVTVDPVKCVGCGRCENACPVAGSAIQVRPVVQG